MTDTTLPKARLEALTDGIFAAAMTLLVLELKIPEPVPGHSLFDSLRRRSMFAMGVVVPGIVTALAEIAVGVSAGLAPWLYLLLIGAGIVRPPIRHARLPR